MGTSKFQWESEPHTQVKRERRVENDAQVSYLDRWASRGITKQYRKFKRQFSEEVNTSK